MFCALLMLAKISGERLQDHWSSGFSKYMQQLFKLVNFNGIYLSLCLKLNIAEASWPVFFQILSKASLV